MILGAKGKTRFYFITPRLQTIDALGLLKRIGVLSGLLEHATAATAQQPRLAPRLVPSECQGGKLCKRVFTPA